MKKVIYAAIGSALLGLSMAAVADDSMMMKHDQMMMKTMDTNGDGKISKDEYMAYQEKKWMSMKKDSGGMVDGKSMMMMMHHDGSMGDEDLSTGKMDH